MARQPGGVVVTTETAFPGPALRRAFRVLPGARYSTEVYPSRVGAAELEEGQVTLSDPSSLKSNAPQATSHKYPSGSAK
jgi:hypothetical protein